MADPSYQVVRDDAGGYVVRIIRSGALPQTAAGFDTEAEAQGWIAQDRRFHTSDDVFLPLADSRPAKH